MYRINTSTGLDANHKTQTTCSVLRSEGDKADRMRERERERVRDLLGNNVQGDKADRMGRSMQRIRCGGWNRGRTGAGAVEREVEVGNGWGGVCLVPVIKRSRR
jgi:hypothetical protein